MVDLGDLELEEPLHETAMGAAHDDLRTVDRAPHLEDEHLAVLADEVALVGRLLTAWEDRLRLPELEEGGARLEALDLAVDDVALAVGVLRVHLLALSFAQGLLDDLLRGLRADAAEGRSGLLQGDRVAEGDVRLHPARRVDLDVQLGVLDLVDDGLEKEHLERAGLDIDLHVDVLFGAVRALDRTGDDVAHDLLGEALLSGELRETGHKFSVHGHALPPSLARPLPATKKVGSPHLHGSSGRRESPPAKGKCTK